MLAEDLNKVVFVLKITDSLLTFYLSGIDVFELNLSA